MTNFHPPPPPIWGNKDTCGRDYLPHQPEILVHFGLQLVDLCEERVFEAPQVLVDRRRQEHVHAQAVHVRRHKGSQQEVVGVELVHRSLWGRRGQSEA